MAERRKRSKAGRATKGATPSGAAPRKAAGSAAPGARKPAAAKRKAAPAPAPKARAAAPKAPRAGAARGAAAKAAPGAPAKGAAAAQGAAPEVRRPGPRARGLAARPRPSDQPDPDSYFVARVRGEEEVRDAPHPMTEAAVEAERGAPRAGGAGRPEPRDEGLGDLPWAYADDALVALPRDPRTLYLYWDHAPETIRRSFEGLEGGRAEIWLFAALSGGGWERVRVVGVALESRGWYLHELDPGRVYRAEIHLVDRSQDRLLPRPSNAVMLPPLGPSPLVDDRFARIAWAEHLSRWLAEWRAGGPFAEDLRAQLARLSDRSRYGGGTWGGSAGGRPGGPGSPSSPWGGGQKP